MSKATVARVTFAVAALASVWSVVVLRIAPFGASPAMLGVWIVAGVASFATLVLAARKPRQLGLLPAAVLLTVGHLLVWAWIGIIAIGGGP